MAQGSQLRLENVLHYPKQFLPVGDERLLSRTVRLARLLGGATDFTLVAPSFGEWPSYARGQGARLVTLPEPGRTLCEGLLASRDLFDDRRTTVVLLGDVIFSRPALRAAFEPETHYSLVGRNGRNRFTSCLWGEIFAARVAPAGRQDFLKDLEGAGALRHLYNRARARGVDPMVEIPNDWTDDVDTEEDLKKNFPVLEQKALEERARALASAG